VTPAAGKQGGSSPIPSVAFYCVADERYFEGAVGLVNSLRLLGHDEPVILLDCGLTAAQRDLLAPQVTLVSTSDQAPPWLLKTVAPLDRPAEVMVLLDADIIVTRPLAPLIETASEGRLVAFENSNQRFFPEWGELLDLSPPRRQPYLGSGAICVSRSLGSHVLELVADRQAAIDFDLTYWRRNVSDYPFLYGDQDVFNAILATRVDSDAILSLEQRLAPVPPFGGLRVVDEGSLRCVYDDGLEPYLVHHHAVKPWLEPTHHGVYSRLLRRLLVGSELAVTVPEREIALRMRTGLLAYAERMRVNARERLRWHLRQPLSEWISVRARAFGSPPRSGKR
jgi:hypothetical protein